MLNSCLVSCASAQHTALAGVLSIAVSFWYWLNSATVDEMQPLG